MKIEQETLIVALDEFLWKHLESSDVNFEYSVDFDHLNICIHIPTTLIKEYEDVSEE